MARAKKTESPLTIEELSSYYREINRRGFGGSLPDMVPIKFTASLKSAGIARAKVIHTLPERARRFDKYKGAKLDFSSLAIDLSLSSNRSADDLRAMLVHEMIHVYFYVLGLFDENHGARFMGKLRELEQITHLTIPVVDETPVADVALQTTQVGVIAVQMKNGRYRFAILTAKTTRENVAAIIERMALYREKSVKVYLSSSRRIAELSIGMKTQRTFEPTTKYYSMKTVESDVEIIQDLEESGELLASS